MGAETVIVNEIILAIGKAFPGTVRAWRNNTGALKDENGRLVRFGLTGSGDITGILLRDGRRLEIEVKTAIGKQKPAQVSFQEMISSGNGVYILARSVEEAMTGVAEALAKPSMEFALRECQRMLGYLHHLAKVNPLGWSENDEIAYRKCCAIIDEAFRKA
jgi:hypothetical protein